MTARCVLVCYLTYPGAPLAQGIVGASGSAHAPTVERSRNGIPVVNINRPSAGGVSRNEYDRFSVGWEGAVLNNSPDIVKTQQAGYIDGNAALKGKSARIILNQVTSANPSTLGGYTEVAGRAAEVVIANPNGISCDGCGFINTTRGVLTTGQALFDKKDGLHGYRVEGGEITIDGAGLNASSLNQLDILSRAVRINSELWADQLNLVTGRNQIAHKTLAATPLAPAGEQGVALDVAAIGGMYANRIRIVGTEKGFGVNHSGQLAANDAFSLSADGRISLAGVTRAVAGPLTVTATDAIENRGETTGATVSLHAEADLRNTGLVQADQEASISSGQAVTNAGTIIATNVSLAADQLQNAGSHALIVGLDTLTAHADQRVENLSGGQIFSLGDMRLSSDGAISNESSLIEAGGKLTLKAEQLANRKEVFDTTEVVTQNVYDNVSIPVPEGHKRASRRYTETIVETVITQDSAEGRILSGGDMFLEGSIDNIYSTISAGGNLSFKGERLNNQHYVGGYEITHEGIDTLVYSERYCKTRILGACVDRGRRDRTRTRGYNWTDIQSPVLAQATFTANQDLTGQAGSVQNGDDFVFKPYAGQEGDAFLPGWMPSSWQRGSDGILLPDTGLFSPVSDPGHLYLVETDPRLTSYREFISSDYMLERLDHDPSETVKRLGDGFVEQRLVRDQILHLTGFQYLGDYAGMEEQYLRLMENVLAVAESLQLRPGVALTAEQIDQLREPIVWMVEEVFQAANGIETAWVPKVYMPSAWDGELRPDGALIAARNVALEVEGTLENSGTVLAAQDLDVRAGAVVNRGNLEAADSLALDVEESLHNIGGRIQAGEIDIATGGDILHQTEAERIDYHDASTGTALSGTQTLVGRQAVIDGGHVRLHSGGRIDMVGAAVNSAGGLSMQAGNDIELKALETLERVENGDYHREVRLGQLTTGLQAGGPLQISTDAALVSQGALLRTGDNLILSAAEIQLNAAKLREESFSRLDRGLDGAKMQDVLNEIILGSQLDAYGAIMLASQGDIHAKGSSLASKDGAIALLAGSDINLAAEQQNSHRTIETRKHSSGFLSSSVKTTRTSTHYSEAIGTMLDGKQIHLDAGKTITITAGQLVASEDIDLIAGEDIALQAGESSFSQSSSTAKKKSGLLGGGLSLTIGSRRLDVDDRTEETSAAATTLGSLEGNINVQASGSYRQTGSDLIALEGDIDVQAKEIAVTEQQETGRFERQTRYRQSGLTLALSSPIIDAIQATDNLYRAVKNTDSTRMQALAAGAAALNLRNNGGGLMDAAQGMATGDVASAGITLSLTVGSSTSSSELLQTRSTARGSELMAGGNINLVASGAGKHSNLLLQGSRVDAGENVRLSADNAIRLHAAENTAAQESSDKSQSAGVGVAVSYGSNGFAAGFTVSASAARGDADGADLSYSNSHVSAGKTLILDSGGDTELRGAVVSGEQIIAGIGGDLRIESLQDTSHYRSRQESIGGSATVGVGFAGSASYANSKVDADYASVTEQSGLQAGDGGFQVIVKGHADLTGAVLSSSDKAVEDGLNRLSTGSLAVRDIQNRSKHNARGVSVSGGFSVAGKGGDAGEQAERAGGANVAGKGEDWSWQNFGNNASAGAPGMSQDKGSDHSTTRSGISGAVVEITDLDAQKERTGQTAAELLASLDGNVRTGDAADGLHKGWDGNELRQRMEAEAEIVAAFSQQANQSIRTYAQKKREDLREQIRSTDDADRQKALQHEINELNTQERVLNVLVGALTGTADVSAVQATLSEAADRMRQYTIADSMKFPGITDGETVLNNKDGESAGLRGDGFATAGTRVVLDTLCGPQNERCKIQQDESGTPLLDDKGIPKLELTESGMVKFDFDRAGMTLAQFLDTKEGKSMAGLTGGNQGGRGTLAGMSYPPGGILDLLHEAYGGSHDFIGGTLSGYYDGQGNARRGLTEEQQMFYDLWSGVALVPSTPFALSEALPPQAWQALDMLLRVRQ